jgi:hypothetical protein
MAGFAMKFPRNKVGLACNRHEAQIWRRNRNHPTRGPRLCPVLWSAPGGWLVVMLAAEPVDDDFNIAEVDVEHGDWWDYIPGGDEWPCEPKREDWGVLNGRLVAVDYAAPAL